MGAVCSAGTTMKKNSEFREKNSGFSGKLKSMRSFNVDGFENTSQNFDSGELRLSISRELKPSTPARTVTNKITRVPQKSSFLGRAGFVGLERAVEVLDTLGSSMSNFNSNSGFISGMASRGNRICILAFEIANTITKGGNLMQSLSQENVQFLKKEVLHSEGVQQLVSTDMKELLSIAAADKREEFGVFSREVIRFGDLCKDPQWHNLDRLDSDHEIHEQRREEAELTMHELTTLAQHTSFNQNLFDNIVNEISDLDRYLDPAPLALTIADY
ncbi:hypothetical protein HYC85_020785 [Camellia sinensis]|uniref:DUF3475 domain-containing protein n=1 Tax=Camellia sinensis TaxID=4442 RepID=A0A7J7GQT4_CAMSI|nr:hypothetical protein HYC85_020785 [Camellia sinensis]